MFRTAISRNTDSSSFCVCTILVPSNIKKKRVNEDETPLTLNYTKLYLFSFNFSHFVAHLNNLSS